jgi:hypothetical protein
MGKREASHVRIMERRGNARGERSLGAKGFSGAYLP